MRHLKKPLAVLIALIVPLAFAGSASAADETVAATADLSPRSGSFFKDATKAANLNVEAEVTTPGSSPLVNPLKNIRITFPTGTNFKPNNKLTPICTDKKLNVDSTLNDPAGVIAACPKSVVGTGTAIIILAKVNNNPNTVIDDPVLVAFNAGTNNKGEAKIKIWGYSKYTNVGILMNGVMNKNGVLNIPVPVLSSDSAVKRFQLELPGPRLDRTEELGIDVQGADPNYVQARCATGTLRTKGVFQLGERDPSTYLPTTPTVTVNSPETTQPCTGLAGKAKLGGVKVKGPNAVKRGKKGTFRVTVRNTGTATAKKVVVTSNRGGKANAGNIAPGASKTVRVKATIRGKKGKRVNVKFTAKSGKVKASGAKKVRVK